MKIATEQGSATSAKPTPATDTAPCRGVIIAHLANSCGAWGRGFVLAVNDLSLAAKFAYKALCKDHNNQVPLGTTQFVEVQPSVWVANMIAQNGVNKAVVSDGCLVDYQALDKCLKTVFERAILLGCNVHIPSGMGSGLAGGSESMIHDIIKMRALCASAGSLEQQMKFVPTVTLWDFQDTTAKSYVGPTATSVVDSVLDTPDNADSDGDTDVLNIYEVLNDL